MIKAFLAAIAIAATAIAATLPSGSSAAEPIRILALGDSLTAGYGLGPGQSFASALESALKAKGHDAIVINAGVSGDTAEGGLARLDWSLGEGADAALVELGANDMLRGIDPAVTRKALDAILSKLRERNIPVLLAGMRAAPNLGPDFAARFDAIYPELAANHGAMLYPFFLEGVAAQSGLLQADGMHPNVAGVDVIVGAILPDVERLIGRVQR